MKNIENEPIFQNPIILDKNGRAFEVTRFKKLYPTAVSETLMFSNPQNQEMKNKLREIKTSIQNMETSNKPESSYSLTKEETSLILDKVSFKNLYIHILSCKNQVREWEDKWIRILGDNSSLEWKDIWANMLSNINNSYVKTHCGK